MFTREQILQLKAQGFVSIDNFVPPEDVKLVKEIIDPIVDDVLSGARGGGRDLAEGSSPHVQILEIENPISIDERLKSTSYVQRAIEATSAFFGHPALIIYSHCIAKPPNNDKETAWHQDSAYSQGFTFHRRRLHWWLPLQEATTENGCLEFVPKSHLGRKVKHRSLGVGTHALTINQSAPRNSVVCPLPVGGCTVHLPKTLHAAGPNRTPFRRTAFILQIGVLNVLPRLTQVANLLIGEKTNR
jgi:hypothetical protein